MSAEIDPAKLKVVELRAELAARGLDTKGNKPVLVKRLKYALEKELEKGLCHRFIYDYLRFFIIIFCYVQGFYSFVWICINFAMFLI